MSPRLPCVVHGSLFYFVRNRSRSLLVLGITIVRDESNTFVPGGIDGTGLVPYQAKLFTPLHAKATNMKAPKTILVPIDMSAYSLVGVQYAQEIAELFDAGIIILQVDDHHLKSTVPNDSKGRKETITKMVQHLLIDHDLVSHSVRIEVREGPPAVEIIRAVEALGADLIVMSTHGRSGLRHILMGSVAEKVVRMSKVPVLTVKPDEVRELIEITEEDIAHDLRAPM